MPNNCPLLVCELCGHVGADVHRHTEWVRTGADVRIVTGCDSLRDCWKRWDEAVVT